MNDIQVLLFCCLIAVITICIMNAMNKATAARLYKDLVDPESNLPKSPYGVSREIGSNGAWGYCITKDGSVLYSDRKAQVFTTVQAAIHEINIIERLEGFRPTQLR